jgi:hypothetical protein|tara:strand:+ start:98 stop:463 length:366 start_codon:yes stop_codon:yes gene_type:complete
MIEFKGLREALTLKTVQPELIRVLKVAATWSNRSGYNIRITSLNDHVHSKNSLHYSDLAADFQILSRSGTPNRRAMRLLAKHLKSQLPYGTDIVFEAPDGSHKFHVHWEYDQNQRPRKNAD